MKIQINNQYLQLTILGLLIFLVNAASVCQEFRVQGKHYIVNEKQYITTVDGNIAKLKWGKLDYANSKIQDYLFPISLTKMNNYRAKYCIVNGKIVAFSIAERRGQFSSGPYATAIDTSNLRKLNDTTVVNYLSTYKKTFHTANNAVLLNATPLVNALRASRYQELYYDMAYSEKKKKIYVVVKEEETLKVWSYNTSEIGFLHYNDSQEMIDNNDDLYMPKLLKELDFKIDGDFIVFCLKEYLYIYDESNGSLYQIDTGDYNVLGKSDISKITNKNVQDRVFVIDKDNEQVYLVSKQDLLEKNISIKQIIELRSDKLKY